MAYNSQNSNKLVANYYEARYICNHIFKGAHLVEPMNQREQQFITSTISEGSVWLGFNDLRRFMHWVKDSNGGEMTYSNWKYLGPWQMYRAKRHCAIMSLVSSSSTLFCT